MKTRFHRVILVGLLFLGGACHGVDVATAPEETAPSVGVVPILPVAKGPDGSTFHFLPPIGPDVQPKGALAAGLEPVVEICPMLACDVPHARFDTQGRGSERVRVSDAHYMVNWDTRATGAPQGADYLLRVRVGSNVLGSLSLRMVRTGGEARAAEAAGVLGVVVGRTLPIRFWIGEGVSGPVEAVWVEVTPTMAEILEGEVQQYSAAAFDAEGVELPDLTPNWSSSDEGIASIAPNGLVTGMAAGAVTIIADFGTAQGSAELKVSAPAEPEPPLDPDDDEGYAYIAETWGSGVVVLNRSGNVVTRIPTDPYPSRIAMLPDGSRAYVTHSGSGRTVSIIDTETNLLVGSIPVGTRPVGIAISPDGSRAYLANEVSRSVSVVDLEAGSVIRTVPLSLDGASTLAVSEDGSHLLVGACNSTGISVIETAAMSVVGRIEVPFGCTVSFAFLPGGARAYALHRDAGALLDLDLQAMVVQGSVPNLGEARGQVIVADGGNTAYVVSRGVFPGGVRAVDPATNSVSRILPSAVGLEFLALSRDEAFLWGVNDLRGEVTIIRVSDGVTLNDTPVEPRSSGIGLR